MYESGLIEEKTWQIMLDSGDFMGGFMDKEGKNK
jgi:hypothetical protein